MDDARLEKLTDLAGGRFRLAALVQKRMQELVSTDRGFGEPKIDRLFETILQEIEEGRIRLQVPEGHQALPEEEEKKA